MTIQRRRRRRGRWMAIEEETCGAREGRSFLHDDYSYIAYVEIEVGIQVKRVDRSRKHGRRGKGEELVGMAECLRIWEEETVGESIFQTGVERLWCALGGVGGGRREEFP